MGNHGSVHEGYRSTELDESGALRYEIGPRRLYGCESYLNMVNIEDSENMTGRTHHHHTCPPNLSLSETRIPS